MKSAIAIACAALVITSPASGRQRAEAPFTAEQLETMQARQQAFNAVPDTRGTGPYPSVMETDPGLPDHVIYRPRDLSRLGRKRLSILIWGNGGCTDDGASARLHLQEIASHGYVAIASGKILSGPQATGGTARFMTTTGADMIKGLDWILAENGRRGSAYFEKVEPDAVAFSGHSCGGILSLQMSADPRVKTIIIHNSGVFPNTPLRPTLVTDKAWLSGRLHTPILYIVGNQTDVGHPIALEDFGRINHVPVFLAELDVGHEGTFREPNGGRAAQVALAWLNWQLRGDKGAARMFNGRDCGPCTDPAWKVQRKGLR